MPIFENEPGFQPTDGNDRSMPTRPPLTSPNSPTVNTNLGGFGEKGDGKTGLTLDQIGNLSHMPNAAPTFDSPFQSVSRKELLDNKRYPMYARDMDLENVYGLQQSWGSQLANGVIKMGATGLGTFAQGFATIPNTISSIKGGVKELSNPNGYEASIDNWLKNVEDIFPNYYTRYEKEHPFLAAVPFMRGSANFWGDKFIKNLGFTAGAIGSALVQDAAIGLVTQGIGEIPLIANQVGKASLWLNKILTGTNDLEKALSVAKTVGASEKALLGMARLEQAAAYTKLTDGFKYGMSLYGSARTEAAVEARDGYNQVKNTLTEQYKLEHLGQEPTGEDAAKIEEYATSAMNARFGANLAILTVSNAIQFDNLFKSFGKASKAGLGSSVSKEIEEAGKIGLKKGSLDEFEIKAADKLLGRVWDKVRPTLPSVFSEGIYEEGGQFAVEKGTYDYYTNKYKNPKNRQYKNDFDAILDSTLKGLQAQFGTQEGIENMMIGGLTGMLTGAGMSKIDSLRGQGKDKRLQTALNMANMYGVTGVLGDKYADTVQSAVIAKEMEDAVANNDIFKYKNLKNDLFFKFVASRIPSGMHDVTIQQLEMLKDLPKEEFEKHFGMDFNESNHATVVSYVDSLIEKANHIKTVTDSLNNTFRNPFTFVNDPKSPQQKEENDNHQIFENFKQELAWTTTVAPDADSRLNSIQQDLININPLLTNDLVSSLTNKKSILELAKTYEQEAYRLGKTLTPSTIESDKKAIQNNIKALRTAAERINLAVQGKIDAVENLNFILNFELNNRQALKSRVIGSEFNEQIFNYSFDINRLNASKDRAREIYDTLATKEGFEKYFNDSKDATTASTAPDPNSDIEEAEIVPDEEEKKVEFENELGEKENIEIGRQYQVTQDRLSKINKLAEDNWEVTAPDGTVKYAATEEEARAIADDIDGDLMSLGVVNVIDINDNGTIKVQDLDGNIQNISPDVIKGYEKIQTRQERLIKFAESVKKFQDELELTSGDVNTEDFTKDFEEEATSTSFEDRKKGAGWLFISSKTASEDWEDPKNSAPHITRSREFLNKAQFFENRADLRVILVTYANEKALGLEGLTALSNDKDKDYKFTDAELKNIQDVNIGFMAQVFVNSKGEYVDKDGKVIAKDADVLDHVIFQTMPITSLEGIDKFGKPYPLYRKQEKAEAAVEQKRYIALREKLMTDASGNPERYAFAISKGIGVTDKAGEDQFNAVDALLPVDNAEQIVSTYKGLIQISITGTIQHNGIAVKVPKGRPTFVYGDTLVTLGNKKFNINSAETVFEILKLASDNIKDLSAVKAQMSYLQNVLYWKKPTEKSNKQNQIFIDENTMNLHLGNRTYDVSNIANLKDEIMDQLMGIYANINNNSLTTNFNTQFREFYVENGELKNRVWDNYQSYLLSNKFPDGSNRSTAGIPLFTNILKASDAVPYSFKQRYSTIIGLDLPMAPAAPVATATTGKTTQTIGKYVADGKTVNTVKLQGETISFKVDNAEFRDAIANQEMAGVTFIQDDNWNKFVEKIGDQEAAEIEVVRDIFKELQSEEASPAPVVPTAPVVEEKPEVPDVPKTPTQPGQKSRFNKGSRNDKFRLVNKDEKKAKITDNDLTEFKKFHAEKLPNLPYEILENSIDAFDGRKAYGVFVDGIAKFHKGAIRGTEYHEIFHSVFNLLLSPEEQSTLLNEVRNRPGTFKDRITQKTITYKEATNDQLEDRIADEYADFRLGKVSAKTLGEKVTSIFRKILDLVKKFVNYLTGKNASNVDKLFDSIEKGKLKDRVILDSGISSIPKYRAVEGLTDTETHEFVQDMTILGGSILFGENLENIYDFKKFTGKEVFDAIESYYKELGYLEELGEQAWEELVQRTKENLRVLVGLRFNDEDAADVETESSNTKEYDRDPFSIGIKDASYGVKLLCGTLPKVTNETVEAGALPKRAETSIGGYEIMNYHQVMSTLLNKLSNTTGVDEMIEKLKDLAKSDKTYVRLIARLGGNNLALDNENLSLFDFPNFNDNQWRLFIDFTQTFTKQNPETLAQYINGNEVYLGQANLYTAIENMQEGWIRNIRAIAKEEGSLIKYNPKLKIYESDADAFKKVDVSTRDGRFAFLNKLGIDIPDSTILRLKEEDKKIIDKEADSIYTYLKDKKGLATLTGKTLDVKGKFAEIARVLIASTNPLADIVYQGVDGKTTQTYAQNNALSVFANQFNQSKSLSELLKVRPQLNDVFAKHALILKKGGRFFDKDGNKKPGAPKLTVDVFTGELNEVTDKGASTVKLSRGDRFVFELNNNAKGNYYAINAGDSAREWGMALGNNVSLDDVMSGNIGLEEIYKIFNGYLLDDIGLALDFKNRKNIKNVGGQNRAKELRFFKSILEGTKQLATLNTMIKREATMEEFEKYINKNSEAINKAIKSYLDEKVESLKKALMDTNRLFFVDENVYSFPKLESDFAEKSGINKLKMTENQLVSLLMFIQANKEISNIEFHKILFGDPYQFAVKVKGGVEILDEVKRIKSFESPRGTTFDQDDFNNHQNIDGNKTGLPGSENRIALTKNDPGYTEAKPYMNTVTVADTNIIGSLMGKTNEADAASILMDSAYRQTKKRNKNWTNEAEAWHQWQMAYTRNKLAAKGEYTYTNDKLKAHDEALINTPEPSYVTEILKPIVSGNKYGKTYIDNVLDKFSQMPMYYKMVEGKALENLYIKMWKENKDYIVTESGRKLGAERVYDLYVGGMLNTEPFNNNIQVGWDIYGIQVETTYDDKNGEGSTGSQLTKVASIDLFDKGVASSEAAKKAYDKNVSDKNALLVNGYNRLLSKLGVKDLGDGFEIVDLKKLSESLEHELLRREASDNAKDVLRLDSNGQFVLPFEAAFAYKQIKDIIYSMVDKSIIRPKVNGGGYVQAPVTMWENAKEGRKLAIKTKDGYKAISREAFDKLSDAEKAKVVLTDDTLKFYTKDAPYIEVLLPHWFKKQLGKNSKFKTDEDLLKYLNSSEEGKAILKGIGFRIPTQALSSVENIVVKGFLPQSMGKTIVVPSEITTKAGSDFDIDKLNLYLKSIYVDKLGNIKLVKLHGSEAETKEFYANVFDETIEAKKLKKAELLEAVQTIAYGLDDPKNLGDRYGALIDSLLEDSVDSSDLEATVMAQLEKLGDAELQSVLKEKFVNDMYRRALENEYTDSLIELITLPENFDRLTTPVDDAGLAAVAKYIDSLKGSTEADIKNKVLDGVYLTNLRHAMAIAKAWVGVVAVNITGHSLTQKANVYIDPARIAAIINDAEREILGNGKLLLKHNTTNEGYVSLSGVKNVNGQTISERLSGYATAVVDVVKDPYILKLIKNELAISTFMFLERAGVGNASLFMNQPIISKFLELSEGTSAFGMFSSGNLDTVRAMFGDTTEALLNSTTAINEDSLAENIRKYSAGEKMTAAENAEQQLILKEFLKYAKMAEYAFLMNQAMNYDTSSYKGGDFLHRKQLRTQLALDSNIFVGIQDVLDNTFLKTEIELLDKATEAVGEILKLEKGAYRYITNKVLDPYALNKYLSEDKFIKIANRIKMSFLDYIIQTKGGYNQDIERLLVDPSTNIANQLIMHKASHPELQILKDLEIVDNKLENGTKSVKLKINLRGDAYLENLYTGYMRELKNTPGLEGFYNDLITVAILQGSYKSPYSIGNIIPIDDYAKGIKEAIDTLQPDITLESYYKNGLFQRNNWKDNDIFFPIEPKFRVAKYDADGSALLYEGASYFPNTAYISGLDRRILTLSEKYARRGTQHDFVKFPRIIEQTKGGVSTGRFIDAKTGEPVTGSQLKKMREAGDLSSKQMYGYQRVMQADGTTPYIIYENGEAKHVYKLINLYGDGQLASEYYNDGRKSVLNNNTVQTTELNDEEVRNILENPTKNPNINGGQQAVPAPIRIQPVETQPIIDSSKKINIYAGTGENAELSNFANRPFKDDGILDLGTFYKEATGKDIVYNTVEGFFQAHKIGSSNSSEYWNKTEKDWTLTPKAIELIEKFAKVTGAEAKSLGRTIKDLNTKEWDAEASRVMRDGLYYSFKENPTALQKLLATGNAELTHTQDKGKWGTEFPKLLMEVREELKQPIEAEPVPVAQVQPMGNILEARQTPIDYTAGQKKALNDIANLIAANKQGYYLLAGYAGTGKTTIAENIIKFAAMNGKTPFVLAPTNKAVKVLNDKLRATGAMAQASTIHSALYGEPDPDTGEWKPKADIKNGVVLIDESSMVDKELMADLLALTKDRNNVLVFMGDKFQLEPVGVDSGLFTGKVEEVNNSKTELTEVKRQALDSNVLKIATITRNDNVAYVPGTSMEDFKVSKNKDEFVADFRKAIKNNENAVAIVATNNERIQMNTVARMEKFGPKRKVLNDNETLIAVANSNTFSNSEIFNLAAEPSELEEHEITFDFNGKPETYKMYMGYVSAKEGDKVTSIKVMHFPTLDKPSLYHAQILKAVRESNPELFKNLDNGIDIMKTKKGAKLSPAIVITTYGYAVTAHKSQGSQWDKVFVNQNYNAPSWNAARWYYTAITRSAKDVVVLPSQYNTRLVPAAIENKLDAIVKKEEKPVSLTEKKPTGITLKDGKRYNVLFINSNMLEAMGYNPTEIGDILKSIC